jgi:hypothetical protein
MVGVPLRGRFVQKRTKLNSRGLDSLWSDLNLGAKLANGWPLPYNQDFA